MQSTPSTTSKTLPLAAALSLACASFGTGLRAFAQDTHTTSSVATSGEIQFDRSDLQRIESFAHFLTTHESLLPPLAERPRIFHTLEIEGVLPNLNLHPLERTAVELLATTDADTLRFRIISTRPKVGDTFRSSDMFGPLEKHTKSVTPQALKDPTQDEMSAYARALTLCHLMAGHLALTPTNENARAQEAYLNRQPIQRLAFLLQTIGVLEVTKKVAPTTLASRIGTKHLANVAEAITEEDRANVPHLNDISRHTGNIWAYRALAISVGAAVFALYHATRRRISASENASA